MLHAFVFSDCQPELWHTRSFGSVLMCPSLLFPFSLSPFDICGCISTENWLSLCFFLKFDLCGSFGNVVAVRQLIAKQNEVSAGYFSLVMTHLELENSFVILMKRLKHSLRLVILGLACLSFCVLFTGSISGCIFYSWLNLIASNLKVTSLIIEMITAMPRRQRRLHVSPLGSLNLLLEGREGKEEAKGNPECPYSRQNWIQYASHFNLFYHTAAIRRQSIC